MQIWQKNLTRVILISMSTISTILGKMWCEMLCVCWGMGEIMDEQKKFYNINMFQRKRIIHMNQNSCCWFLLW